MIRYIFLFIVSAIAIFSGTASAETPDAVGIVTSLNGDVRIMHKGEENTSPLSAGTQISLGDTITTINEDSYVRVDFIDNTHISLSDEDAELTIDKYVFDPANLDMNTAQFTILRGSFEFVGGLLDKGEQENVQINLDFGSIGIRGTHIHRTMKDKECWIYLEDGEIRVFNGGGSVLLTPGQSTRISSLTTSPVPAEKWNEEQVKWIKEQTAN